MFPKILLLHFVDEELEDDPVKLKQFVMSKLEDIPNEMKSVVEKTQLDAILSSPLKYRRPWELLWGNISKGNVCVAGDALHPMTPELGQGGCAALEDGVVLARCIAEALLKPGGEETNGKIVDEEEEYRRIEIGLKIFAQKRRWRSIDLISTSYMVMTFAVIARKKQFVRVMVELRIHESSTRKSWLRLIIVTELYSSVTGLDLSSRNPCGLRRSVRPNSPKSALTQ
ncbi:hypothetical protein Golob_021958, partial [Gossypium lobatum]|nr:hypothetical protein [Gossypium lobatum]